MVRRRWMQLLENMRAACRACWMLLLGATMLHTLADGHQAQEVGVWSVAVWGSFVLTEWWIKDRGQPIRFNWSVTSMRICNSDTQQPRKEVTAPSPIPTSWTHTHTHTRYHHYTHTSHYVIRSTVCAE